MDNHHGHEHRPASHTTAHTTSQATSETGDEGMAELLDLDAEVLGAYLSDVTAWIHALVADPPPARIIDLGSGTGTGTFSLLDRFADTEVIALDYSADLLRILSNKARDLGVGARVRTIQADLDAAWPAVGSVELVWASNFMHHLADPDRVLADVFATIRPGGLLVVAEMDSFPRFLPDDIGFGRPGLEARCHDILSQRMGAEAPHLGADWGPRLSKAGFAIEAQRHVVIELTSPLPSATGRYAQLTLERMRSGLDGRLDAGDLAALDTLLGSDSVDGILNRSDLTVRSARTVWVAMRP
jgi:SAM-dependent methyltransferase